MDGMDSKTLEALGGKITKIVVGSERKLNDGQYGSIGGSFVIEMDASPEADATALAFAAWEYAKAVVDGTVGAAGAALMAEAEAKRAQKAQDGHPQAPAAPQVQKPPQEPTRTPVDDSGREYRIIDVDYFAVEVGADGVRKAKVFGGPYKKFGVRCWPEPLEAVGIQLETLEAGKFSIPEGYAKAKVLMEEDKPKKVWAFLA